MHGLESHGQLCVTKVFAQSSYKMKLTSTEMGKSGGGAGLVVKIRSSEFEILGFTCSLDI